MKHQCSNLCLFRLGLSIVSLFFFFFSSIIIIKQKIYAFVNLFGVKEQTDQGNRHIQMTKSIKVQYSNLTIIRIGEKKGSEG